MKNNNRPLVSIIVPSYNSEKTIIETLDSIKAQDYEPFEVIISDDASIDNTVQVCRSWLENNPNYLRIVTLLTSNTNVGTCKNLNRAINHSKGDWIKAIAADDRLLPNCLKDDVKFITQHPDTDLLFTDSKGFGNNEIAVNCKWVGDSSRYFNRLNAKQFKLVLLQKNFLSAPSAFIKMETFKELGGFDENFKLVEDWPFWLKALDQGKVMKYMPTLTVEYRLSETSVSNNFQNSTFMHDRHELWMLTLNYMRKISFFSNIYVSSLLRLSKNSNLLNRLIHSLNVFNPFYWEIKKARKFLDS